MINMQFQENYRRYNYSMRVTLRKRLLQIILLIALFCTSFSSLVYELVWCRELSYIFGSTALAASSVLSVFMAGLALGSLYAGKMLESRKRQFRFLALLQFAIGIACILTLYTIKVVYQLQPYLFSLGADQATSVIKIALFLLTSCVLIVPTFLIGVAFPCIVQLYHAEHSLVGRSVSRCYWVDTLGASAGMLLAAFFIVPTIGFFRTSLTASTINIFTGILAICFFRQADCVVQDSSAEDVRSTQQPAKQLDIKIISFLFFLSGFAALVLEIIWIRHWELIYGGGLHAFAIVVVIFLLGLSFGSFLYEKFLKKIKNQVLLFSTVELSIGATAIIITILFPYMERVFLKIYYNMDNYHLFIVTLSSICLAILLVPTTLMGMTLPTLSAINVSGRHIAVCLGRLFAVNSLGALMGSFCAGFVIIPALGIYNSSFVAGGIYIFIAFAFLYCFSSSRFVIHSAAFIGILIITGIVSVQLYKPNHLYTGVFYLVPRYVKQSYQNYFEHQKWAYNHLRFAKDGVYGQVIAYGQKDKLILSTDGAIDSSTRKVTSSYQSMLGHIPMIVHKKPSRVLNIGLGCGWTVGSIVQHPLVESVDSVEINPLIVEANQKVFYVYNNDILTNPKVRTIINDGRNYVSYTKKKYDVIISEPPEFWISGVSALFTKEFYTRARSILNADGMMCQWFPCYEITERDYKIALNTIKSIFPYTYEFDVAKIVGEKDHFLIIALRKQIDINERLEQIVRESKQDPNNHHAHVQSIIRLTKQSFSRDNEALEAYIADVYELHTDDLPVLEFHASRGRFRKFSRDD